MNTSSFSQLAFILQTSALTNSALHSPLRKQLDASSTRDFHLLLIAIGVVAVGIIFEWAEVKEDIQEWWGARRSKWPSWIISPWPGRRPVPIWALIGFLFVAFGVGAEGIFEGLMGIEDSQIRKMDETTISTDEATISANELEAAKLRLDLAKLQHATLPRSLDVRQTASKLARFRDTTFLLMTLSDFEPSHTAAMIGEALKEAKWKSMGGPITSMGAADVLSSPGIWIVSTTSDKRAAQALASALREEGVEAHTRPCGEEERSAITIVRADVEVFVSLRPMPGMPADLRVVSANK